jgi:hypothetical protein
VAVWIAAFIDSWADIVVARRRLIIVCSAFFVCLFVFTGPPVPYDNTRERFFLIDDPTLEDFDQLVELFGDQEYLVVGVEQLTPGLDIFNPESLSVISTIAGFLDSHRFVSQTSSILSYQYTRASEDNLATELLIKDAKALAEADDPIRWEELRSIVASEHLAIGSLLSQDLRHARISARVEYRSDTADHKVILVQELFEFLERTKLESERIDLHISGTPLVNERIETIIRQDLEVLLPIMGILMLLMLYLNFRDPVAVVVPGVVIAGGVLAVNELQGYLGFPHSVIDQILLPTMVIIGVGMTVHVLVHFQFNRLKNQDSLSAARQSILRLWKPTIITATTTSAGFLALSVIRISPIREFAFLGAAGPLILFLVSLTILPALLSIVPPSSGRALDMISSGLMTRITDSLPEFTLRHRNSILLGGLLSLVFAIYAIPKLQFDTNYLSQLKPDNPVRQDIEYLDRIFRGMDSLEIVVDSGVADGTKNPAFLQEVDAIQEWLMRLDSTGKIISLVDYLKQLNQVLNNNDPAYYRIPATREQVAQFLLLYTTSGDTGDLSDIMDFGSRFLRLTVPVVSMTASESRQEFQLINSHLQTEHAGVNPILSGGLTLSTARDIYATEGMIRSFGTAVLVISALFLLFFKSFKYGTIAIVASVLPILLAGGLAGLLGVYLNLNTMLIAAMTMGIAVDDSVHVISRYLTAKSAGLTTQQSIARTMRESGRAVIFSSIILAAGFSVFYLASFTTVNHVGIFASIIMVLALLGDLLLLPAVLYLVDGEGADNVHSHL